MSHNPILNAYLIELNPINKKEPTFRHFCKAKFFKEDDKPKDEEMYKVLFENFLKELAGNSFYNDKKSKKVLGVQQIDGTNKSIISHFNDKVIEGIIDGGKYGISRQMTDIDKNNLREQVSSKKAILDKYYFYLHTPLNSKRGMLLIQSYTEETIQQPFQDLLKSFFSCEEHFYNLKYDVCIPKRVKEDFAKRAVITMFKYKTIIGVGNQLQNQTDSSIQEYEVVIEVKPKGKVPPTEKNINGIVNNLSKKKFENNQLGNNPTVFIRNEKAHAHFDVKEQISKIKPTIYLKNEGVDVNEETGIPNFVQVKEVCERVLQEIMDEIEKETDIDEL